MSLVYYDANSNVVELTLTNAITDSYINDATVTVTIKTLGGVDVAGETWPLSMPYVTDSDGVYRATLEDITISLMKRYMCHIVVDANGNAGNWEEPLVVLRRSN